MSRRDRTAIVTGAGTGIGHAIAARLLMAGFDVAMAGPDDKPAEGMPQTSNAHGARARYFRFDLADVDSHMPLLDAVETELGPVTCLVNNAGVSSLARGDLLDLGVESFDRSVAVNLRGTFFLTQAVARRMLGHAHDADAFRSIITIGSVNARIIGENRGDYCITKTGLSMMTKLFASRLAADNIAVFEVRPGIIRTQMTAPSSARYDAFIADGGVPMQRWGNPDDVAETVCTLASGGLPFATGMHVDVSGGMQLHRV